MVRANLTQVDKDGSVFADDNHYTFIEKDKYGHAYLSLALKPIHNKGVLKNIETVAKELDKLGVRVSYERDERGDILKISYSRENLEQKRTRKAGPKKKRTGVSSEEILEMNLSGMPQKEIAEKLNLSQASVSRRLKEAKEKRKDKK